MKHGLLCVLSFILFLSNPVMAGSQALLKLVEGDSFITDLRYNTTDNFLKKNVYAPFHLDRCYVHPKVYQALQKAVVKLKKYNLKLVFWDCYRPVAVQQTMWKLVPDDRYVADPKEGSSHNRGVAVDVTLANEDGTYLEMPTGFDNFSEKAAVDYRCAPEEKQKCQNRNLLKKILKSSGLRPLYTEWWHYQLPGAKKYSIIESLPN